MPFGIRWEAMMTILRPLNLAPLVAIVVTVVRAVPAVVKEGAMVAAAAGVVTAAANLKFLKIAL